MPQDWRWHQSAGLALKLASLLRKVAAFLKRMSDFAKADQITSIRSVGVSKWMCARFAATEGYQLIATDWVLKQALNRPPARAQRSRRLRPRCPPCGVSPWERVHSNETSSSTGNSSPQRHRPMATGCDSKSADTMTFVSGVPRLSSSAGTNVLPHWMNTSLVSNRDGGAAVSSTCRAIARPSASGPLSAYVVRG
jgi:hypothetical protein